MLVAVLGLPRTASERGKSEIRQGRLCGNGKARVTCPFPSPSCFRTQHRVSFTPFVNLPVSVSADARGSCASPAEFLHVLEHDLSRNGALAYDSCNKPLEEQAASFFFSPLWLAVARAGVLRTRPSLHALQMPFSFCQTTSTSRAMQRLLSTFAEDRREGLRFSTCFCAPCSKIVSRGAAFPLNFVWGEQAWHHG